QAVQRTALLERGGELQVLELQEELAAGDRRQRARMQERGVGDLAADALARGEHVARHDRVRAHVQRPVNFGGRRSTKERTPSAASSLAARIAWRSSNSAIAAAGPCSTPRRTLRMVSRTAI